MSCSSYQVIQPGILPPATVTGAQACWTIVQACSRRARIELLISTALKLDRLELSDIGTFGFCEELRMLSCVCRTTSLSFDRVTDQIIESIAIALRQTSADFSW